MRTTDVHIYRDWIGFGVGVSTDVDTVEDASVHIGVMVGMSCFGLVVFVAFRMAKPR